MNNRQLLRETLLTRRSAISPQEQQVASQQLLNHLCKLAIFTESQRIALYMAICGEMDPAPLMPIIEQQHKTSYLPLLDPRQKQQLCFAPYSTDDKLVHNRYNILEPVYNTKKIIPAQQLDLVLLPLVAFDTHGNRLGMGAGYYDRTFAFLQKLTRPAKPYLLGVAYDWQRMESLPAEAWDVPLDGIITEKIFYAR